MVVIPGTLFYQFNVHIMTFFFPVDSLLLNRLSLIPRHWLRCYCEKSVELRYAETADKLHVAFFICTSLKPLLLHLIWPI